MQLLEIWRVKHADGSFTFQLDMAYSTGRRKTREILLDAPGFSEFTWDRNTERFSTREDFEMGAVANRDFDRIERWIEDVFDECAEEGNIHVDDMMKRLLTGVAEKESAFRARFVGNFRMFRRGSFVRGIARPKATDEETIDEVHVTFPPIPPYSFDNAVGIEDLPF